MPGSITLQPNIPMHLALESTEGELDSRYPKVHYMTTDGRVLTVSTQTAAKINMLELRTGEAFCIIKRVRPEGVEYEVWLAGQSEKSRAEEEQTEPNELEQRLARSLASVPVAPVAIIPRKNARRAPDVDQPRLFDKGTGTDGPAPLRVPLPAIAPSRPVRVQIPFNIAFVEVTQFVIAGLAAAGEQWNDEAKQGMVSTVLIAAAKAGMLTIWEREK